VIIFREGFKAIQKEKPYAVFVATGSTPILPSIDGIRSKNVCVVQEALVKVSSFKGKPLPLSAAV
jgi:hypothetical protein